MIDGINCTKTENYLRERGRMSKKCVIRCDSCPLGRSYNGEEITCLELECRKPDKAIAIVQKWSDENPQALLEKTLFDVMKEKFPKMPEQNIKETCPSFFGLMEKDNCIQYNNCTECWNRPYREEEQK